MTSHGLKPASLASLAGGNGTSCLGGDVFVGKSKRDILWWIECRRIPNLRKKKNTHGNSASLCWNREQTQRLGITWQRNLVSCQVILMRCLLTLQGTITYPTQREKENHGLKTAIFGGYVSSQQGKLQAFQPFPGFFWL